jgi:hypothetical protein
MGTPGTQAGGVGEALTVNVSLAELPVSLVPTNKLPLVLV